MTQIILPFVWQERFQHLFCDSSMITELINTWNKEGCLPPLQHTYGRADPNNIVVNPLLTYLCSDRALIVQMVMLLKSKGIALDTKTYDGYATLLDELMNGRYDKNPEISTPMVEVKSGEQRLSDSIMLFFTITICGADCLF